MFTVKIIGLDGTEWVKQTETVVYENLEIPQVICFGVSGSVPTNTIKEGDVYVMNENGKTVADYHLHPIKI